VNGKRWTLHAFRSHAALVLVAVAFFILYAPAGAHEIPARTTVHMFAKPESQTLRVLVRVPLAAIREVEFPLKKENGDLLDLGLAERALRDAATGWLADFIEFYEEGQPLGRPTRTEVRAAFASDQSFASYEQALAHVTGPRLPPDTVFILRQGLLDVLFEYRIGSEQALFSFSSDLRVLGNEVVTVLRFLTPGGAVRAFEYEGNPGIVYLDPRWHQAAWTFVKSGFFHILDGVDHLLFLFCLVIPFRRIGGLIPIVTAFTVAHSVTLVASAYGMAPGGLWFPPLIETLIAASIVYMALENIVVTTPRRRWLITFGFGLVHGFGFSFALRETLQFAGSYLLTSLLAFNIGVEIGQIAVLALMVPAIALLFRSVVPERTGTILLSALAAHTAWHWMTERYEQLARFEFTWPVITAAFLATVMRWAMLAVVIAAAFWLLGVLRQSRRTPPHAEGVNQESASAGRH
jgi:HupE / UreJ protein